MELSSFIEDGTDISEDGVWYTLTIRLLRNGKVGYPCITVWFEDMHKVKRTMLIQSEAGIISNTLIPSLMGMLCLLITVIHNQFWLCINSNAAYLSD